VSWQLSRPERKCLTTVGSGATVGSSSAAAVRSPLRIARCGARSDRWSQTTIRSPVLNSLPGCLFVRRHVREADNRIGLRSVSGQAQIRPCTARPLHHAATAVRLSEVDASGDALSAPITVNNSGIDARNGQAYHGRKTIATNGARPAASGSRAGEGQRAEERQRRQLASCVRSCTGTTGRARILRAGTEAAIVGNPLRCKL